MPRHWVRLSPIALFVLFAGCGNDECTLGDDSTCDPGFICVADGSDTACLEGCVIGPDDNCPAGQVCETVAGQNAPDCAASLFITGQVFDAANGAAITGALVSAVDENGAAASEVVPTDENGFYKLQIFSQRAADGSGTPVQTFTLRAGAQDFQEFPFGVRPAIPINAGQAVLRDGELIIDNAVNAAVDVALLKLPANQQGFPSISGTAEAPENRRGVLVVAESNGVGFSTLTDLDGDYTIFNVPPNATYTVNAFAADVEYGAASVNLGADDVADVDLALSDAPTLTNLAGQVNIVNAPGGSLTSVVLIVRSTFNEELSRGQVPPGLRAPESGPPSVSGAYDITGVPDGEYVVLAAFENDGLVRDPDTSIGGNETLFIRVQDGTITNLNDNTALANLPAFKVTEALEIIAPGAGDQPEQVSTATPDLTWFDDSSEDEYQLVVFDAFGTEVFAATLAGVSGADPVVPYAGVPLVEGMFYQFRVTSIKDLVPISKTEDLRGVFFFPAIQ